MHFLHFILLYLERKNDASTANNICDVYGDGTIAGSEVEILT